jgi:hypothetical protein
MPHTLQTLQRKCSCGGTCGSCNQESQLRRSAIVSNRAAANAPGAFDDPLHQPMLDQMREEGGLDPQGFPDAYLKYSCPPGRGTTRRTVDVQPVRIAQDDGSNPSAAPALGVASTLWPRCCVHLNILPATTLNRTEFQTITGDDTSDFTSAEETRLINTVARANRITVVTFRNFESGGVTSTATHGGAGTALRGTTRPVVYAVDIAVGEVIAHEIGHALGYAGHNARDNGTIMETTGSPTTANPTHVSRPVCAAVRTGPVATASTTRCCQDFT